MARYLIEYTIKRKKGVYRTEPTTHPNQILSPDLVKRCKTIVVLRDSEGEDHPANAGKFFLYRIVK